MAELTGTMNCWSEPVERNVRDASCPFATPPKPASINACRGDICPRADGMPAPRRRAAEPKKKLRIEERCEEEPKLCAPLAQLCGRERRPLQGLWY